MRRRSSGRGWSAAPWGAAVCVDRARVPPVSWRASSRRWRSLLGDVGRLRRPAKWGFRWGGCSSYATVGSAVVVSGQDEWQGGEAADHQARVVAERSAVVGDVEAAGGGGGGVDGAG